MQVNEWTVNVIRCAYHLEGDERDWLARLGETIQRGVDGAVGALSCRVHIDADGSLHAFAFDAREVALSTPTSCIRSRIPERWQHALSTAVCGFGTIRTCELSPIPTVHRALSEQCSICFGVFSLDVDGAGWVLLYPLERELPPRRVHRWKKLMPHIEAGWRLRRTSESRTCRGCHPLGDGDARGLVSEHWKRLAIGIDSSEGAQASTGQMAALRRELLNGKRSLLQHFVRDGRRYLLIRHLATDAGAPLALTPRELCAIRLAINASLPDLHFIAQAMKCKESTVATHLARAMKKIGVRSRAELIASLYSTGLIAAAPFDM